MSVRSYFGPIEPLTEGESIVVKDVDGIVYGIQGLSVGTPPTEGAAGEVLTSDGAGGISWEPAGGGPGVVPTLTEVMEQGGGPLGGAIAGSNLDMGGYYIEDSLGAIVIDTDEIFLRAPKVEIQGPLYLTAPIFCGSVLVPSAGLSNYVLVSRGPAGGPPEWINPPIPSAQGALDMNGYAINDCSSYGGNAGTLVIEDTDIEIRGAADFDQLPTTSDPNVPSSNAQLVTKLYVDTIAATINGVLPSSPAGYSWAGPQIFEHPNCSFVSLIQSGGNGLGAYSNGAVYAQVDTTQKYQNYTALSAPDITTVTSFVSPLKDWTVMYSSASATANHPFYFPQPDYNGGLAWNGMRVTIMNNCLANENVHLWSNLTDGGGAIAIFVRFDVGSGSVYEEVNIPRFENAEFVCVGARWACVRASAGVVFSVTR